MTDSSLERRRSPRVPLSLAVELRDQRGFSLQAAHDLSLGGLFFDRAIPHPVGSKVTVAFKLPGDDRSIVCEGEVANVPDQKSFGMGVRFLNLEPADRDRLAAFMKTQGVEP